MFFAIPADWVPEVLAAGIKPRQPDQAPFWAEASATRAPFLQAVQFEHEGRWDELAKHCRGWLMAQPDSVEARDMLELARAQGGGG
ncbi:MAG: serine protease, partial [Methyloversatilis sp.]|nr:serine protease [Methyloversatilis sp.]